MLTEAGRAPALQGLARGAEKVPRFEVDFVPIAVRFGFRATGAEHELVAFSPEDDVGREDIPDIFRDDEARKEVDCAGGVACAVAIGFERAEVTVAGPATGGLHLDTNKVASVFDADVVGRGISPGLGYFESAAHALRHELQLDPLATHFEVLESLTLRHMT